MSSTALILRPENQPPIHVLEVDGPRHKHPRQSHPICTSNWPRISYINLFNLDLDPTPDPVLADWDEPYWEIYQHRDGAIVIHANRPTEDEVIEGDLQGALGSVIKIERPTREIFRRAMRIARRLLRADPDSAFFIRQPEIAGIHSIETDLPVYFIQP